MTNRVRNVDVVNPPITVIAIGALSSDPSSKPSASDVSPIIVVSALIRMGRWRILLAMNADSRGE